MYICATYPIFEKMIFAKVSLTLLILNKVRAQRGATAGSSVRENFSVKLYRVKECTSEHLYRLFRCRVPHNGSVEESEVTLDASFKN